MRVYPRRSPRKYRTCGLSSRLFARTNSSLGRKNPELMDVATNSVPTTGVSGRSKSTRRSFTQAQWMSPDSTTGLATPVSRTADSSRVR